MFLTWRKRTGRVLWILLLALILPARADSLDEALQKIQTGCLKPGYGICLFDSKGMLWSRYEGHSNEEAGIPFSPNTILRIGAASELFTVVMALQLVDAGLLDPEMPIATYLPELFSNAPTDSPIEKIGRLKVRLLMSHLSGTNANFFLGFRDYDPFLNLRDYLQDVNLKYRPETKYLRSGAMIDLLGLAIEKVSGKHFEDLARMTLFAPLGMEASSFRYQDSPLLASLRYKSAAPDSYATRISGFREAVAPSGSMQASLKDLVAFYSALLRERSAMGPHLLARNSFTAMFSSQSEDVARRQGLRIGYAWQLSLPELAYLGKVAWYSGKHLSHRNIVILLPELGVGVTCATNAWSIFDRETILPMAIAVLKTYARDNLKRPEPSPSIPVQVPMPRQLKADVSGLYASTYGVYHIRAMGDVIEVCSSAMDSTLQYIGQNEFWGGAGDSVGTILFSPPDTLQLSLRNGVSIEAQRARPTPAHRTWLARQGTYRIALSSSGALYAFTLSAIGGLPVISGDDGVELLLEPLPMERADILCDEASRFFGKGLQALGDRRLLLDGIPYQRIP